MPQMRPLTHFFVLYHHHVSRAVKLLDGYHHASQTPCFNGAPTFLPPVPKPFLLVFEVYHPAVVHHPHRQWCVTRAASLFRN